MSSKGASDQDIGLRNDLIRIRAFDLKSGHYVIRLNIPWRDAPFPLEGVLVSDGPVRDWIVEHCEWVDVDLSRSPNKVRPKRTLTYVARPQRRIGDAENLRFEKFRAQRITQDTLKESQAHYQGLRSEVDRIVDDFSRSGEIEISGAKAAIVEIADSLGDNLAALAWLIRIKDVDQYTAQHCMNVSILCIALAHAAGWKRERVEDAGLAGLLHDLGKTRLNQDILNKPGRLSEREFDHIRAHSMLGYQMLSKDPEIAEHVRLAVRYHHERPDGNGYPDGLSGDEIPDIAKLVSIVDAYDAITSERIYDPARSHHEALGILYKERDRQFDRHLVETLIRLLGWVTYGTLVRLTDGRIAVVIESKSGRGLFPLVRPVLQRSGQAPILEMPVDLHALKLEHGPKCLRVADVLPDGAEGIKARDLMDQF